MKVGTDVRQVQNLRWAKFFKKTPKTWAKNAPKPNHMNVNEVT